MNRCAAFIIAFALAAAANAETVLLDKTCPGRTPIDVAIPAETISEGDRAENEISIWVTAGNGYTGWTWAIPSRAADLYVTDGTEQMPLLNPKNPSWGDLGPTTPGERKELKFALPKAWLEKTAKKGAKAPPLRLVCPKGIFCWGGNSHGDFKVEIWKGIRAEIKGWVDNANRCGFVDMKDIPAEKYVFEVVSGGKKPKVLSRTEQTSQVFRIRMPQDGKSSRIVNVEAYTKKDGVFKQQVVLAPHEHPLKAPLAPGEVLVGHCVYDGSRRFADEIVTNDLANLITSWNKLNTLTNMPPEVRKEFDRKKIHFMTVYGYDKREDTDRMKKELGDSYLWNNVGELAGYLYQGAKEASAVGVPIDMTDLGEAKDRFVNVFMQRFVKNRHSNYDFIFSTSGSPLACYELQGGMDFMANELYAVGSANLAYVTSESRGAARKWKPEFWGGWLAEEWQTFPVPYDSEQKYDLLRAGLYQQYLMGTSVIVLESGAQTTQAQKYTNGANDIRQMYDDHAPTEYRKAVKEFYQWTRANPRDPSQPITPAAFVLGNNDGFVGMSFPSFAIWGQHGTAETNKNWKCGSPEATWGAVKSVAFPIVKDALAPYPNHWLAATPYGQIDVTQIDNENYASDLARYDCLIYAGWNTMTKRIAKLLANYVQNGGDLLLCLPHLSTRSDRNMDNYNVADLIGKGDLSVLMPLKVKERKDGMAVFERIPPNVKVLENHNGLPVVLEAKLGKGTVRLVAAWDYPGDNKPFRDIYKKQVADMLEKHAPPVTVSGDDANRVSYSVYDKTVYILNMDCVKESIVKVNFGKKTDTVRLAPHEIKVLKR